MSDIIQISPINHVYMKVRSEDEGINMELSEFFTFKVPGYRFMPAFRAKRWDGNIRLYNLFTGRLYVGLLPYIHEFAESRGYSVEITPEFSAFYKLSQKPFSLENAANFFTQLNLHASDAGELKPITPHDYQIEAFCHAVNERRSLLLSPTSCHPKGTKVVMVDGSIKDVSEVKIGDKLIGPDGFERNVLKLNTGKDKIFKISPIYGKPFYVNENHILSLVRTNTTNSRKNTVNGKSKFSGNIVNISVKDYLTKSKTFKHEHKLYYNSQPLNFLRKNSQLPIDPYFLGVLLGDGSLTSISVTTMDSEVVNEIYKQAKIWDLEIRIGKDNKQYRGKAKSYNLTSGKFGPMGRNKLLNEIKKLGLFGKICHSKFVPDQYKFGSIEARFQILAGLLDTDGWKEKKGYNFCTKSKQLNDDVAFIARSLGFKVNERLCSPKLCGGVYYESSILGNIEKIPLKIQRKRWTKSLTRRTNPFRSGFKIESVDYDTVYGFTLDKDSLYFLDDFLVTHNSGKSLILYALVRWYRLKQEKILIIVPTTSLVEQMYKDFGEYSVKDKNWDSETQCHRIYQGKSKDTDSPIVISTWQSIYKMPVEWFDSFGVIIGDEAHNFKAESLKSILEKTVNAPYKIGTTGTLDGTKTHKLVLEGLFGKVYKVITTAELMEQGKIADMKINCLVLQYPEPICKLLNKSTYQQEIDYITDCPVRNQFIRNLVLTLHGNTLVLFRLVSHGKQLFQMIQEKVKKGRKVFFVYGGTDTEIREGIRVIAERETDAIIVASYGTFSTGVNIRNIDNIVFSSPSKSRIRTLQSIGRGLRISARKKEMALYDIADDLKYKKHKNHTLNHFLYRLEVYQSEKFNFQIYKVKLKESL